ncbi:MAG TPA: RDD family protein [Solirubrobacteraceae bacterium]|nr:RDD family protein [Solirubrobacteraceae bacterium]
MVEIGPGGLTIAPLRRRLAAGVIDTVVVGVPTLAVTGGATAVYLWLGRRRGRDLDSLGPLKVSPRWNPVIRAVAAGAAVPSRNWRSPGYRRLGLRRVDVRTGGPLSVRNALVRDLVIGASAQLRSALIKPWRARYEGRVEALQSEMERVRRTHPNDPAAQQEAMREAVERHDVSPARSCAPALVGVALMQAPALWSPLNQTLAERLAGIVVVQQ